MKLKYLLFVSILGSLFGLNYLYNISNDVISISERSILVNNENYFIKGVCYHPVPRGSSERNFSKIDQDLSLMVEAGINTIRVYSPIDDLEILNKIEQAGLKIIISFGYNQNGYYDILSGSYVDYVKKYKNHNSILFWELGNEYNYHPEWFDNDISNWYTALNTAAGKIHEIDKSKPVSTAHGEIPDSLAISSLQNIDVWGLNVYRWDDPSTIFKEWEKIFSGIKGAVDIVAFQDGHVNYDELLEFIKVNKELADKNGCTNYSRVPALGTNENYIKAMSDLIINKQDYNLNGKLYPPKIQCPNQFKRCPCLSYE